MNELNLYELYKNIIAKSKVMKRFVIAPGYGKDLNKNNFGELAVDIYKSLNDGVKYPVCIMFPPVEFPDFDKNWSRYNCKLFFLTHPFDSSKGTMNKNPFNALSMHTVQETWKDMNVCAKSFRKFLIRVIEKNTGSLRDPDCSVAIERFSEIGNDGIAGVSLTFDIDLVIDCDIEDYSEEDISSFQLNKNDLHKHHAH
ncbi:hypothetical protein [Chryseobacterium gambrini]|uniref:hypothetical protein n=1 Tax=Chryseobacterium gambrini TaxID=373672 RepID=UPI003D10D784